MEDHPEGISLARMSPPTIPGPEFTWNRQRNRCHSARLCAALALSYALTDFLREKPNDKFVPPRRSLQAYPAKTRVVHSAATDVSLYPLA